MMSRILVLKGSPRLQGNSNILADAFIEEAKNLGNEVHSVSLSELRINPCHACDSCQEAGHCVIPDDFFTLSQQLMQADSIVIASPVYWYSFPAQVKAVIDRFYSIYEGGKDFTGKKTALISVCEEESMSTFEGICFAYRRTMELMHATLTGEILIPGVYEEGDVLDTDGVLQVQNLARTCFNADPDFNFKENANIQTNKDSIPESETELYQSAVLTEAQIRDAAERWICGSRIYVVTEEDGPDCYVTGPDLADWIEYDIMDLWDNLDWNSSSYKAMNPDDLLKTISSWKTGSTEDN